MEEPLSNERTRADEAARWPCGAKLQGVGLGVKNQRQEEGRRVQHQDLSNSSWPQSNRVSPNERPQFLWQTGALTEGDCMS